MLPFLVYVNDAMEFMLLMQKDKRKIKQELLNSFVNDIVCYRDKSSNNAQSRIVFLPPLAVVVYLF